MKKSYKMPQMVEYGSVDALTLGSGGSEPDYDANTLVFINNNANCQVITPTRNHVCYSQGGQILGGFS